ncbi:class I SAM-dependent methyltransferase [Brevundimonas sp.]|uniref:class I SAM-dependent methyltransferase n=1 Tax=Brevundimonas sp. TaxID=1871086 RepID=UPI002D81067D|nr:class I SAM-dependent methyltransferase [Brevundimonas sp.]
MSVESPSPFADPAAITHYADNARRTVPGLDAVHRMASVLLAERAPADARILVLGAGGGLELKVFADDHQDWTFDGVDPAPAMLDLARATLGADTDRVTFHTGYIDSAPEGPFDGGACLLTMHFLDANQRLDTLKQVRRRLKPGAPFVVMHISYEQEAQSRELWLDREEAYLVASGGAPADARRRREAVSKGLHSLSPEQDEALLVQAGFSAVSQFYSAFTFRGWVAYA